MSRSKKKKTKNIVSQPKAPEKQAPPVKARTLRKIDTRRYSIIITAIFLIVASVGMIYHEMWRDEYQAWLVARDAHSISQLFHNLKYEGNPALSHIFLYM